MIVCAGFGLVLLTDAVEGVEFPGANESDEFILIIREHGGIDHVACGTLQGQMAESQPKDPNTQVMDEGFVVDSGGKNAEHRDDRQERDHGEDGNRLAGERRHRRQDRQDAQGA